MAPSATVLRNRLLARARFRHLFVFVKTVDLGSLRLAAEAVGITQPSATEVLADLEGLLGCQLFLRHSRGMVPTHVGVALAPLARRLLELVDDGSTRVAALIGQTQSFVRVASISAAVPGVLTGALPAFSRAHPDVTVQVQEADFRSQSSLIASREVDIALCRPPETIPDGWTFTPLLQDRFAIICAPGHGLARKRSVTLADLQGATWLVAPVPIAARRAFDELFEDVDEPPKKHGVVTVVPSLILALLEEESLLALMPGSLVGRQLEAGELAEIPWRWKSHLGDVGMLVSASSTGPAVQKLSSFLLQFSGSMASEDGVPAVANRPAKARGRPK